VVLVIFGGSLSFDVKPANAHSASSLGGSHNGLVEPAAVLIDQSSKTIMISSPAPTVETASPTTTSAPSFRPTLQPIPPSSSPLTTPQPSSSSSPLTTPQPSFSSAPSTFRTFQKCLGDSPFVDNNAEIPQSPLSPSELEEHYYSLLEKLKPLRTGIPHHEYIGYKGPWIENWWIDTFCCNKSIDTFGGMVPLFVQWVDLFLVTGQGPGYFIKIKGEVLSHLRSDVIYVTVSQSDSGIYSIKFPGFTPRNTRNILVLSAGGFGHVPLPLLGRELSPVSWRPPIYGLTFAGTVHFPAREDMARILREIISKNDTNLNIAFYKGNEWLSFMQDSMFNLAPRGFGRSSFRFVEIVQLNLVPVYVYDDHDWTAYKESPASASRIGYSVAVKDFGAWCYKIASPAFNLQCEYEKKLEMVKIFAKSHYSFEGIMQQISYFLQGDSRGNLKCQRHPTVQSRDN